MFPHPITVDVGRTFKFNYLPQFTDEQTDLKGVVSYLTPYLCPFLDGVTLDKISIS